MGLPAIASRILSLLNANKARSDADKLARAGWSFVEDCEAADTCLGVYRRRDGHLALAGKSLNIKFASEASASDIDNLLSKYDMRKRRQLGFAKNLMTVELQSDVDTDLFSLSAQIEHDPCVEFAEPVVLEAIGPR